MVQDTSYTLEVVQGRKMLLLHTEQRVSNYDKGRTTLSSQLHHPEQSLERTLLGRPALPAIGCHCCSTQLLLNEHFSSKQELLKDVGIQLNQ